MERLALGRSMFTSPERLDGGIRVFSRVWKRVSMSKSSNFNQKTLSSESSRSLSKNRPERGSVKRKV